MIMSIDPQLGLTVLTIALVWTTSVEISIACVMGMRGKDGNEIF
jgi:hypothetical protein